MNTSVGYVLVSQVFKTEWKTCPNCRSPKWDGRCAPPKQPRCHAVCIPHQELLAQHPECQQYQRDFEAWHAAHFYEASTGGTRVGPLHYFSDCTTLLKRGPRRADARIVPVTSEMAAAFAFPICKECAAKMAPLEQALRMPVEPISDSFVSPAGRQIVQTHKGALCTHAQTADKPVTAKAISTIVR